jgi:hypothetical protein
MIGSPWCARASVCRLFFGAQTARNKAARIDTERATNETARTDTGGPHATATSAATLHRPTGPRGSLRTRRHAGSRTTAPVGGGGLPQRPDRPLEWSLLTGQSITLSMEYLDALRALGRASIRTQRLQRTITSRRSCVNTFQFHRSNHRAVRRGRRYRCCLAAPALCC